MFLSQPTYQPPSYPQIPSRLHCTLHLLLKSPKWLFLHHVPHEEMSHNWAKFGEITRTFRQAYGTLLGCLYVRQSICPCLGLSSRVSDCRHLCYAVIICVTFCYRTSVSLLPSSSRYCVFLQVSLVIATSCSRATNVTLNFMVRTQTKADRPYTRQGTLLTTPQWYTHLLTNQPNQSRVMS
jgi:hypothetical protein